MISIQRTSNSEQQKRQEAIAADFDRVRAGHGRKQDYDGSDSMPMLRQPQRDMNGKENPFQNKRLYISRPERPMDVMPPGWNDTVGAMSRRSRASGAAKGEFKSQAPTRSEMEKLMKMSAIVNRKTQLTGATGRSRIGLSMPWQRGAEAPTPSEMGPDPLIRQANGPRSVSMQSGGGGLWSPGPWTSS